MIKRVIIFGATGSVGTSALNVIRRNREQFQVIGITANKNIDKLSQIADEFGVKNIGIFDRQAFEQKKHLFEKNTKFFIGEDGLCELAKLDGADSILMAIVGISGLLPTMTAIDCRKNILLASKEILVVAGQAIMERIKKNNAQILPVDSEHNAIFQCLAGNDKNLVDKIILTASGGPFRTFSAQKLSRVTVEQALRHPTWNMGTKITIDSATMANKGFEIIEARWLFSIKASNIDVVVHPESIIHSMVKFCDGSTIAQLCAPNMEHPISNCLFFPHRETVKNNDLDFMKLGSLTFFPPDNENFPLLSVARQCLMFGKNKCAVYHAANEVAVELFLSNRIKFTQIAELVIRVLDVYDGEDTLSLESCIRSVSEGKRIALDLAKRF